MSCASAHADRLIVAAMNLPSFMDGATSCNLCAAMPWIRVVVTSHDDDVVEQLPTPRDHAKRGCSQHGDPSREGMATGPTTIWSAACQTATLESTLCSHPRA